METEVNTIDLLLLEKEDTEKAIEELQETAIIIEGFNGISESVREKRRQFLGEIDKEIEYNEAILQEINEGISFLSVSDD